MQRVRVPYQLPEDTGHAEAAEGIWKRKALKQAKEIEALKAENARLQALVHSTV